MGNEETRTILGAEIEAADKTLNNHLLDASPKEKIASARAIHEVLNTEWRNKNSQAQVLKEFGDKQPTAQLAVEKWRDHAIEKANEILAWEATPKRKEAWENRRKTYKVYINKITKNIGLFHEAYQQLTGGVRVVKFKSADKTSEFMTALKSEFLAWYDSQRPAEPFVRKEAQNAMVQFLTERREMLMLLKTIHAEKHEGPDRQLAVQTLEIQLALAPVVRKMEGLYATWDGKKTLTFKDLTEIERAVLATAVLVPVAGRLLKAGRLMYTSTRISQVYGGNSGVWERVISYSAQLSKNRQEGQVLDKAFEAMEPGKRLPRSMESEVFTALPIILRQQSVLEPVKIEQSVTDLWADLKSKHPWLASTDALLDEHALRRILLMGPNLSHLQSQFLAELAESRIGTFLRDRQGLYSFGITVPSDSTLEFVPGHAFRAGDKDPAIRNRQISDGVLGYWQKGTFIVAAILEAKVGGEAANVQSVGGRELGHTKNIFASLTRREQMHLRAYSNREWIERKEITDRNVESFGTKPTDFDTEILKSETGSQVARDVARLDTLDDIRINGILARFQLSKDPAKPTKILAVMTKGTKLSDQVFVDIKKEVKVLNGARNGKLNIAFQFEPFAIPFDAAQLKRAADGMVGLASKLVYCPGTTNDSGSGCTPADTPSDFIKYIREVYDIAVAYQGVKDADQRVTEWMRHIDYNDDNWDILAGSIDKDWIAHVKGKYVKLMSFVSDPLYPVNIKVSHFGASIDGGLRWGQAGPADLSVGDVTGWAGDWITFYNDWQKSKVSSGSKYCWETLARPGDAGSFKLRDLIEDADAFNVSTTLRSTPSRSIVAEIEEVFRPGGGYKTRFSKFFQRRFGGSAATATAVAKDVLTTWNPAYVKGRGKLIKTKKPDEINPADLDDFCKGFGDVLADIASSE